MTKNLAIVLFIFGIVTSKQSKNKQHASDDYYSHIGKSCEPEKIAKLPCLKEICAEIDHEIKVWEATNGSVASKLQHMYDNYPADITPWIAAFISAFNWTFDYDWTINDLTSYMNLKLPFDPDNQVPSWLNLQYFYAVSQNYKFACDIESFATEMWCNIYPQMCSIKCGWTEMIQNYRQNLELLHDSTYLNMEFLSFLIAPFLFLFIPLGMINAFIIYRVAKECPAVWYHVMHAVSDVLLLFGEAMYWGGGYMLLLPLFAWSKNCVAYVGRLMEEGFINFFRIYSAFCLTLLCCDRYIGLLHPHKYHSHGAKTRKYLIVAALLTAAPIIIELSIQVLFFNGLGIQYQYIGWAFYYTTASLYCAICLIVIIYCCIRTANKTNTYQPPPGSSNFVEQIAMMKRFFHLTIIVLILNSAYVIWVFINSSYYVVLFSCTAYTVTSESFESPKICNSLEYFFETYLRASSLYLYEAEASLFTSNIGLFVHCIFSRAYRNEFNKLCKQSVGRLFCKKKTPAVAPL